MIQPGLERIAALLKGIDFPWKAIHVAGTNGKGSVCNTVHTLLQRRCIKSGLYCSPHLMDRWDCIRLGDRPPTERQFRIVEDHFLQLNQREAIGASEFEIMTATAFQLFNDNGMHFGVIETGMGGSLDATNVLNNQIVSVITKISLDHQGFLGNTLQEIAEHKAGILRPGIPYAVDPLNEQNGISAVIRKVAADIGAGPQLTGDLDEYKRDLYDTKTWLETIGQKISWQQDNTILGILAFRQALGSENEPLRDICRLLPVLKEKVVPGRLQTVSMDPVLSRNMLIDGAHNEDAATALSEYVNGSIRQAKRHGSNGASVPPPRPGSPITWIIAMSSGRDPQNFLRRLLRPEDNVIATTFEPVDGMPWVKPLDPDQIAKAAQEIGCRKTLVIRDSGAYRPLFSAKYLPQDDQEQIVMTGSLYLVGQFLREQRDWKAGRKVLDLQQLDTEGRNRVKNAHSGHRNEKDTAESSDREDTKDR